MPFKPCFSDHFLPTPAPKYWGGQNAVLTWLFFSPPDTRQSSCDFNHPPRYKQVTPNLDHELLHSPQFETSISYLITYTEKMADWMSPWRLTSAYIQEETSSLPTSLGYQYHLVLLKFIKPPRLEPWSHLRLSFHSLIPIFNCALNLVYYAHLLPAPANTFASFFLLSIPTAGTFQSG